MEEDSIFPGWKVRLPDDSIFVPDFGASVFKGKEWQIFGGARSECLPEIELWLSGHGIETDRIDHLVWG